MKKGMINLIILALVIVNLALSVILIFTFVPSIKKSNSLIQKVSDIVDLNIGDKDGSNNGVVDISDLEIVPITFGDKNETVISLKKEGNTNHYLKLSLSVNLNKKSSDYDSMKSYLESSMQIVNSTIIHIVSKYTDETITQELLEKDILKELNKLFNSNDLIYKVSISQYVIQ